MTDYLTTELLDAAEIVFSAEREHRKVSWMDRSRFNLEVMKFQDEMRRSDERAREAHIKNRKQRESKFKNLSKIMMRKRHQTWAEIMQDLRRKYAEIPSNDKEAQLNFILHLYKDYYFSATLIGSVTNRSAKAIWLLLEEWAFENGELEG